MFTKDFYPTPYDVVERLINGNDLNGSIVLEPSAGSGNILDVLKSLGAQTVACEKHPDLAEIAIKKCDHFLAHDFLKVTSEQISHVDLIIMNPPFSADEKHILHAWEIAPDGCEIAALCNWETIDHMYTMYRRRLKQTIDHYGFSENLGPVFDKADRKTDIDVGLVRLYKPNVDDTFEDYFDYTPDEEEAQAYGIMPYNAVREVVQRYVGACKLFDQVAENAIKMNDLVGVFGADRITYTVKEDDREREVTSFKIELQKKAWSWIFRQMNMERFMTKTLRQELNRFTEKQQNVPFTMKNIYRMFEMVAGTHDQRMKKALVDVFERLTRHHDENRYHLEGWKTNSHYLVNRKFILPDVAEVSFMGQLEMCHRRHNSELVEDLIKALDYMTGQRKFEEIEDLKRYVNYMNPEPNTWYEIPYFHIKLFKKGTMHAKFKDEKVWERYNRAVAEEKGFELPERV